MADINVLMVGGRRAGKTSLLAAIKECCDQKSLDKLDVSIDERSLNNVICEMNDYFIAPEYSEKRRFELSNNCASDVKEEYEFEVNVNGFRSSYTIGFTDVPGEYYGSNEYGIYSDEKFEQIRKEMAIMVRESQVFLIAVDTPHLMQKNGAGHEWFNRVPEITELFKNAFKDRQHRLVLFVPIKCEYYVNRNRMKDVAMRIQEGYADLIRFLTTDKVGEVCTVAIAPIVTLGGAEFLRFPRGDVKEVGEYVYVEDNREYSPANCEQPLMIVLKYLLGIAKEQKENQNRIIGWFREKFMREARLDDLLACEEEIRSLVIDDIDQGYVQLNP